MTVARISRLGGPPAAEPAEPHAVPYPGATCPVRLLSLPDGTDVTAVRELYARVSGVLEPPSVDLPPDFSSGGGDRTGAPRRARTEEARRSGVAVRGEPLRNGSHKRVRRVSLRQSRRPTSFQAAGSAPIASAAFSASPSRKGTRPAAIAALADMPVDSARYGTPTA